MSSRILFFLIAAICLFIANAIKVFRISLFIEKYEKPNLKVQARALALAIAFNSILPFRLGHLVRALYSGKRMKNGVSFSFAAIVSEVVLDFLGVIVTFLILHLFGAETRLSIFFYCSIILFIAIAVVLAFCFKKYVKKIIFYFASLFNEAIKLKILKTSWFIIISLKNIIQRTDKVKLFTFTFVIWGLNFLSCYLLAGGQIETGVEYFNFLFSGSGIIFQQWRLIFIALQLVMILSLDIFSFIIRERKIKRAYINLLPHNDATGRLKFLEMYYLNDDNGKYFTAYKDLNSDVAIIEDYSAGSNATTMLCSKGNKLFYRKYAFGEKDAKKLHDQIDWIKEHEAILKLTNIDQTYYNSNVCSYDMPFIENASTCFNYVHTIPTEKAWKQLKTVLNDLSKKLHTTNQRKADKSAIEKYIQDKVDKNIALIEKGVYIRPLLEYDYLYVNNKKYRNLKFFKKFLSKENLEKVFKDDSCSDIHGDFTIENIVCVKKTGREDDYYIIDPNTGNIHDTPYLDFAKLLQSLHGGYEFLMKAKDVSHDRNRIDFLYTKSFVYEKLYKKYLVYLKDKFGKKGLRSIFYHEVIHWLRLMPYKIEKNGERSLIFYSGLIMVLNDTYEMFEKERNEK